MATILTCLVLGGCPGAQPADFGHEPMFQEPIAPLCCTVRGGHAVEPPARGGEAVAVLEAVGDVGAWTCIHQGEGAWNSDTGNGYHGGLQMDVSFMTTYGSDMVRKYGGYAERWTPRDQMVVAERARQTRGYYPWPNTARACGLI